MLFQKKALPLVLLAVCCFAGDARAGDDFRPFQAGDILVHGRAIMVSPNVTSSVSAIGGQVEASRTFEPEVDLSYFFTPHLATEVIAGVTRHKMTVKGTSLGEVELGKVTLLPPTVTLQYHFLPQERFNPYLGAGINYTVFFDEEFASGSAATGVDYDNGFGAVLQAGFNYQLRNNWYMNFDVKHIFLHTRAIINSKTIIADVDLDPTIVGLGLGYRF